MGRVCETPSTGTPRTAAAIAAPSVALAAAANLRDQEDWRRQAKRAELAYKLTQTNTARRPQCREGQGRWLRIKHKVRRSKGGTYPLSHLRRRTQPWPFDALRSFASSV